MQRKILLASPHMSKKGFEKKFVKEAFKKNWIAPVGPNIISFEKEIASKVKINSVVALTSGTASIHMALKASGVSNNDIVLCQSLTFAATVNPILYENAKPVFIDSDYETWNMNPQLLEKALKKYPTCKAVIVVHLYGISADLDKIVSLCKKYKVTLIEDAAESLGTKYKGKYTGTFGDYGIYSFNGNKIITTSGGGVLISNISNKIEKVRFWSTQSRDKAKHYQHSELGYNYRMSNVVAGIGRGQLKILDKRVKQKRQIYFNYKEGLKKIQGIKFMPMNNYEYSNCWLTCIILEKKISPIKLINHLEKENIESRPLWKPMHMQPVFKDFDFIGDGTSEDLFKRGICLPSDTKMSRKDQNKVINKIKDFFNNA